MTLTSLKTSFAAEYEPKRLKNWQVPKWFPDTPLTRKGNTKIIANDRGNLLPGIPRSGNPFGDYVNTWDLPKKITRDIATQLSAHDPEKVKRHQLRVARNREQVAERLREERRQLRQRSVGEIKKPIEEPEKLAAPAGLGVKVTVEEAESGLCFCTGTCTCGNKYRAAAATGTAKGAFDDDDDEPQGVVPYVPGDLTNPRDRFDGYEKLDKNRLKGEPIKTSKDGFPKYTTTASLPPSTQPPKSSNEQVRELLANISDSKMHHYCQEHDVPKRDPKEVQTYLNAAQNFQLARELHDVNLEHEPLPDTVPHHHFREMQMQEPQKHPGLAIKGANFASAIGWKGYAGFGANRCTKLKIFRPKSCGDACSPRPSSINSFDKKWRFLRQNKVTPIDLAICWDMRPVNPDDEPKRSKHIDGSNGSMAPAVFSMVVTPKVADENDERNEPASGRNVPAIFNTIGVTGNIHKIGDVPHKCRNERPKTTCHLHPKNLQEHVKRTKSAYNLHHREAAAPSLHGSICCAKPKARPLQHHQSTPNVSHASVSTKCSRDCCNRPAFNTRLCVACELRDLPEQPKPHEEFKMAFKAGIPNNTRSSSGGTTSSRTTVKVPKQRNPYGQRSYSIDSLNGPFCLQKDKREDYPEHWRLASVYQHSYKPMHMRKKSLLQSVYK